MKKITRQQLNSLIESSSLLSEDKKGAKVFRDSENNYFKIFRQKRMFSLSRLIPYAKRFAINAQRLQAVDVPTIHVTGLWRIAKKQDYLVRYKPLDGLTIRELLQQGTTDKAGLIQGIARFMSELHRKGVYFRSLHLGNIVYTGAQQFGLIDVADMRVYKRPLNDAYRIRNFYHLFRYAEDLEQITGSGLDRFMSVYLQHATIQNTQPVFMQRLKEYLRYKQVQVNWPDD